MINKIALWFGAVSPILYTIWAAYAIVTIAVLSIHAWIFVTISAILALFFLLLMGQYCWEQLKKVK